MSLDGNGLLPQHLAHLRASQISDAVATARGYHSVTTREQLVSAGFSGAQLSLVPAMLIPVWGVNGKVVFNHIRPDVPRVDAKGKPKKYEFPAGMHMDLDVPPHALENLGNPSVPLWITEGSKKADSAVSRGLCCVSVIGTWNWRGTNSQGGKVALAAWECTALNNRLVYLCFDSDAMEKKQVYKALARFSEFLKSRGAKVRIVYLPAGEDGSKTGLDDFFARGGTPSDAIETATSELKPPRPEPREPGEDEDVAAAERLNLSDLGNARRLVRDHGKDLKFCSVWNSWMVWDGSRWKRDDTQEVQRRTRLMVATLYREASEAKTVDDREAVGTHAIKSESHRALSAAEAVAQAEPGVAVSVDAFDQHEWLLNLPNGTVDLRTGKLHAHQRSHFMTKLAGIDFVAGSKCPTWDAFLLRIMDQRQDLVDFLRRAVGYSLTGSVREQALFFCYGSGANGKSTFIETLRYVFGDYATAAKFDTFLVNEHRSDAREDIASLRGARFVSAVEGPEGKRFDEASIKQLTGGDTVRARFLYEGSFEFRPTCKIWLAANHKPQVRGTDDGVWRRMRIIPFGVQIPDIEKDADLLDKLRKEALGILSWAVNGAVEWHRSGGLGTPIQIVEATAEYREESDTIGEFLEERCQFSPEAAVWASELFQAYKSWSESRSERPLTSMTFGLRLKHRRGVAWSKNRDKRVCYQGLRLSAGTCG